jgi:beta-glucosidase
VQVGRVIGREARATHNMAVHAGRRSKDHRAITLYAPNMNVVRDPRWGRAQEVG